MKNLEIKITESNERNIVLHSNQPLSLNSYWDIKDEYNPVTVEIISTESKLIDEKVVYISNAKPLKELTMAINPLSKITKADGKNSNKYLLPTGDIKNLMTVGTIRGTEHILEENPQLKGLCKVFENGEIIEQDGVPFMLNAKTFREYPHFGLLGGSGSGKTYGLRVICEELMEKGFPNILLDPHNEMTFNINNSFFNGNYSSRFEIFEIGENIGIEFTQLTTLQLMELVEFMGDLTNPMKVALEQIHEYGDTITHLVNKVNALQLAFANEEKNERDKEVLDQATRDLYYRLKSKIAGTSTLQALAWRLQGLLKQGVFKSNSDKLEQALKLRKTCVIRGSKKELNMIAAYVIRKMYKKRRDYIEHNGEKMPPFFVVTDEAHIFAPRDAETPTVKLFVELAQEARKYGVFLGFATQRPNLLHPTVMAQLNTKFIFRTVIANDIKLIRTETNLTEAESSRLPFLTSGNAFVSSPVSKKSLIKFRASNTISPNLTNPLDELDDFVETNPLERYVLESLPIRDIHIKKVVENINNTHSTNYSNEDVILILNELVDCCKITVKKTPMGKEYRI